MFVTNELQVLIGKQSRRTRLSIVESGGGSVGIATDYGLDDRVWGGLISGGRWEYFSSPPRPDLLCDPYNLLSNGYLGLFPRGIKRSGREVDRSLHSGADLMSAWRYTSNHQYVFMAWCLVKQREKFTFTLPYSLRRVHEGCSISNTGCARNTWRFLKWNNVLRQSGKIYGHI
jgi:hypothetical protein